MKRSFLEKLQRTALLNVIGALLWLLIVPTSQLLILGPQGYGKAPLVSQASLIWLQGHLILFLLYRITQVLGFVLLLGLPFALFRIIVAQEIIGRAELEAEEEELAEDEEEEGDSDEDVLSTNELQETGSEEENSMPAFAWRGKGFAVIAAWTGLLGLLLLAAGTLFSTIHLWSSATTASPQTALPDNFASVSGFLMVLTYTIGGGLLAIAALFFGIVIARSGRKLWPTGWVAFGYTGTAVGAVASGSAVQVALAPTSGQAMLTIPAILFFALWSLWFGLMIIRLRPE